MVIFCIKVQNILQKGINILYNIIKGGIIMKENEVRQFADKLREQKPNFSMKNIVNDVEKCIESIGIKVFYSDMSAFDYPDSVSGYTRVNDMNKPEIVVNSNHVEGRRRFTMAHELGHILIHWDWPKKKLNKNEVSILYRNENSEMSYNLVEQEANEFAAQLLLPLNVINEALPKPINDFNDLEYRSLVANVSKSFNVTKPFARRQLDKLRATS